MEIVSTCITYSVCVCVELMIVNDFICFLVHITSTYIFLQTYGLYMYFKLYLLTHTCALPDAYTCTCSHVCPLSHTHTHTHTHTAPEDTVKQLSVSRTLDNKTIVVFWEPLVTTPPAGRVERYEVQYRNLGKELINTLRVNAQFNYFVIAPVEDANEYEVCLVHGCNIGEITCMIVVCFN